MGRRNGASLDHRQALKPDFSVPVWKIIPKLVTNHESLPIGKE
jgi:hypothetical protein